MSVLGTRAECLVLTICFASMRGFIFSLADHPLLFAWPFALSFHCRNHAMRSMSQLCLICKEWVMPQVLYREYKIRLISYICENARDLIIRVNEWILRSMATFSS